MMELKNFGAILTFAAELEEQDREFYLAALNNPASEPFKPGLDTIAKALAKNNKNLLRVRQENVTEMILEPIHDFRSEDFALDRPEPGDMNEAALKEAALKIEDSAIEFYGVAAKKIDALKEVSRALKQVAKKRTANKKALD
jgi:rubrerythrin